MAKHMILLMICAVGVGVLIGLVPFPTEKKEKAEQEAERLICEKMATDVIAGTASRFDYMATRCSAQLLMDKQGN